MNLLPASTRKTNVSNHHFSSKPSSSVAHTCSTLSSFLQPGRLVLPELGHSWLRRSTNSPDKQFLFPKKEVTPINSST
jgi:hypothetical protein